MGAMLTCCMADAACCAGKGALKLCGMLIPWSRSTAAKFIYAGGFMIVTIIAYILHLWGSKIVSWIPAAITDDCGGDCFQFFAVFKTIFASVIVHALYCLCLIGVSDSENPRSFIQYGLWPIKALLWVALWIGCFFMQNYVFVNFWIAAVVFSAVFIIVQAILLVDFAHSTAEKIVFKYEETSSNFYKYLLIFLTVLLNALHIGASAYLYIRFKSDRSIAFITINLISGFVIQIVSILPAIQEANPRSGLFQAAILMVYSTYLTGSALMFKIPNFEQSASAFDEFILYSGIILTFVSLVYGALSTGTSSGRLILKSEDDDEDYGSSYNYSFFHFVFIAAACYTGLVLTYWQQPTIDNGSYFFTSNDGPIWLKISISWFVTLLYVWTLVAPLVFPDREFGL